MLTSAKHMSDEDFVEFCYLQILGRKPDGPGHIDQVNALRLRRINREELMRAFIASDEFQRKHLSQEFVPAGHFASAIPSIEEREAFLSSAPSDDVNIPGIDFNAQRQFELLQQFKKHYDECPFPEQRTEPFRYHFCNPTYSYADALTLYSMLRHFAPKRVIEIGSGFSSCVMLDTNDHFFQGAISLTFIDPYPMLLRSLLKPADERHSIIPTRLQETDKQIFGALESNDILFVDSTHVSKLNSDVNMIFFELLPSLKKGVLIHFHDIFRHFEYPKDWIREGRAWNEAYMLRAFLEYNQSFEILCFSDFIVRKEYAWFEDHMPLYLKNTGGSIWLRKIAD
jgi:predicted O-methyltransferase YrrM